MGENIHQHRVQDGAVIVFEAKREVPDLQLCKELRELGYPQDGGGWYWHVITRWHCPKHGNVLKNTSYPRKVTLKTHSVPEHWVHECEAGKFSTEIEVVKAPAIGEMGEWLPTRYIAIHKQKNGWLIYDNSSNNLCVEADTEANARAKLLIWLAKNGYLNFNRQPSTGVV